MHVTFIPEKYLRTKASEFLDEHKAYSSVPVDIERIVEFDLRMDVIPIPGLRRLCRVDAFVSSDLQSISADDELFEPQNESRYRFSLAHEVAHCLLHKDILGSQTIACIADYVAFFSALDPVQYDQFEWQANQLAGLILVPPSDLKERFAKVKSWAEGRGVSLERQADSALYVVANRMKDDFRVSRQVVEIRLKSDGLMRSATRTGTLRGRQR